MVANMKISCTFLVLSAALALPAWGAGSVEAGRTVFQACQSCHTDPATAQRFDPYRFDAAGLTSLFRGISQMTVYASLGTQNINDLVTYLGLPNGNDTDRLLNWAEDTVPQLLSPRRQPTGQLAGYNYRFYPDTGIYLATKDSNVWYVDSRSPNPSVVNLGTMRSFMNLMPNGQ